MNKRTPVGYWYVLAVGVILAGQVPGGHAAPVGGEINAPVIFAQVPAGRPAPDGRMPRYDYGQGGRIVRLDPDGRLRVLTEGFVSACECDVSFDGRRILFAGRRTSGEPWNIWEMNADGSGIRPITHALHNCRRPAYLGTLYTLDGTPTYQIAFMSDAPGLLNEYCSEPLTNLYACLLDGSHARRLTFNLGGDRDPAAMADGRILLASRQGTAPERGTAGGEALFAIGTDGTDYSLLSGDQGQRLKRMPCITTDGLIVFIESDRDTWDGAGQLASVSLRRSLYSHRRIAAGGRYLYHSPSPLSGGKVLVSRRPADGSGTHAICRLDPLTGQAVQIHGDAQFHDVYARALAPHPEPDGRSSSVSEKFHSGKLYCLDVYTTDRAVTPYLRPGMVHRLRVIEGVPVPLPEGATSRPSDAARGGMTEREAVGLGPMVPKRLLGDIPVEADGSFQIELPADVPVQLQTLDENGMALRSCGWIWAKPREWRGCIGCHEDPERVPENVLVEAVKRPAISLMLPEEKRRTVDFQCDLAPIIAGKCATAACHGGTAAPDLTDSRRGPYSQAYASLLAKAPVAESGARPAAGRYVHPGQARTSPLIWRLFGRNTSRPWDASYGASVERIGTCPPPNATPLANEEKAVFVEWIDLGAPWSGPSGADGNRPSACGPAVQAGAVK